MSGSREPTFATAKHDRASALRRLDEIERRLGSLRVQFEANKRELREILDAEAILLSEHASLRASINAAQAGTA